jgi:hypothetical protein
MILLYLDESGSLENPGDYFVVGGVAVAEQDLDYLRRRIEGVARKHLLSHQLGLELHAQPIRTGKGPWGSIPRHAKAGLLADVPRLLGQFKSPTDRPYALFAVAKAPGSLPGVDPLERTFEEILLRFTEFLIRTSPEETVDLGLVIADKAKYELILQPLVTSWRDFGTRRGTLKRLRRLAEVPLFVDSKATRLIQMADFVAHSVYRQYQASDSSLFAPLLPAIDSNAGVLHGLVHLRTAYRSCPCPACISRATAMKLRLAATPPPSS